MFEDRTAGVKRIDWKLFSFFSLEDELQSGEAFQCFCKETGRNLNSECFNIQFWLVERSHFQGSNSKHRRDLFGDPGQFDNLQWKQLHSETHFREVNFTLLSKGRGQTWLVMMVFERRRSFIWRNKDDIDSLVSHKIIWMNHCQIN